MVRELGHTLTLHSSPIKWCRAQTLRVKPTVVELNHVIVTNSKIAVTGVSRLKLPVHVLYGKHFPY